MSAVTGSLSMNSSFRSKMHSPWASSAADTAHGPSTVNLRRIILTLKLTQHQTSVAVNPSLSCRPAWTSHTGPNDACNYADALGCRIWSISHDRLAPYQSVN